MHKKYQLMRFAECRKMLNSLFIWRVGGPRRQKMCARQKRRSGWLQQRFSAGTAAASQSMSPASHFINKCKSLCFVAFCGAAASAWAWHEFLSIHNRRDACCWMNYEFLGICNLLQHFFISCYFFPMFHFTQIKITSATNFSIILEPMTHAKGCLFSHTWG